jgi:hypothetical protein
MNSFLRKVEAERQVLSIVNHHTKGKGQLTGLSNASIKNWCSFHGIEENNQVLISLLNLADLCNSLSDRSNENFTQIPTERMVKIKAEKLVLSDTLMNKFN